MLTRNCVEHLGRQCQDKMWGSRQHQKTSTDFLAQGAVEAPEQLVFIVLCIHLSIIPTLPLTSL